MQATYSDFFRQHPALLYGISTFFGIAFALNSYSYFYLSLIAFSIYFPLLICKNQIAIRSALAILFGICVFALIHVSYQFPENLPIKEGIAEVEIEDISLSKTPFGSIWKYKGILTSFSVEDKNIAKGIPIEITFTPSTYDIRPLSGFKYEFKAALKASSHGKYILKPSSNVSWHMLKHVNNLSELRHTAKSRLKTHLEKSIKDPHVREFLKGIITGEFEDNELSFELGRFGLQHLTAISGLHFSIMSTLLGFIFCLFLPRNLAFSAVIIFMTSYFIFLGTSPSVVRAFTSITIAMLAIIIQRKNSPLNAFGIALMSTLLINPLFLHHIGFQFSFGITLSILLWTAPCDNLLTKIFPSRSLNHALHLPIIDQYGLLILHFLRQALSLSMSVNLAAIPLTLFHFHQFQMMGLIYNLFFPILITVPILLLLLAIAFEPIFSSLTNFLHSINEYYTKAVLNLGFYFPKSLDAFAISTPKFQEDILVFYLFCLFYFGAILSRHYFSHDEKKMIFAK